MGDTAQNLQKLRRGSGVLLAVAILIGALSIWMGDGGPDRLMLAVAASLAMVSALVLAANRFAARRATHRLSVIMEFLEHDSAPGFCTSETGAILSLNAAARERFGEQAGGTMTRALESLFANPDAVVHRLRLAAAEAPTGAREDVVTRRGHVRVAVHRMPAGFLWRLEDLVDRPKRTADGLGLPILTFGPSGTILYMNEVLRSSVGQRAKRLSDLFEDLPLSNGGLHQLMTKDGSQSVRVVLSEAVNGRQEVFVLPGEDQDCDQVALDTLPVALLRLDSGGSVVFANRLARDLLPAVASGQERRLAALVEGLGRSVREWVSEAAAGRGLYRAEVVRVTGAEVETYLQITLGRPVGDGEGALLAVLNDATELKTLEAQFVQSQKMQAIGQLAGGVAHDFNNLLTAISGHCDLLMLRHGEGDEDHADLTQITQNANRAAALVGQLLAFSRKQTLEMQPIDLRDTLGDLAHLLNRLVGERVTLRLEHDPALIPIRGDRRQLEQVLMNLVVNARDAMPSGGEILISTECRYLDRAMTRDRVSVPSGQYVVVVVSDAGQGITPDNLTRIFEPFFTTKRPGEGTGLGLSMAYGIVKQSGGYIFADSVPNEGTRFSLFFPAIADGAINRIESPFSQTASADELEFSSPQSTASGRSEPWLDDAEQTVSKALPLAIAGSAIEGEGEVREAAIVEEPGEPSDQDDVVAKALLKAADVKSERQDGVSVAATDIEEGGDDLTALLGEVLATSGSGGDKAGSLSEQSVTGEPRKAEMPCARDIEIAGVQGVEETSDKLSDVSKGALSAIETEADPDRRVVLLVEDEAPVRAFASRALRLRGYEVREAENAEAALEQLEDADLNVDLFVTDVMMPGLDGPTWVREAMKTRPNVRTIFISGYTQDAMSETSVPIPNSVFLPKPFSLADLTRTVQKALS